jgi:hypothetical protein
MIGDLHSRLTGDACGWATSAGRVEIAQVRVMHTTRR